MRKLFLIGAMALFFGFNVQAIELNPYVSGKISFVQEEVDFDGGELTFKDKTFGESIALGIAGSKELPFRVEFEYSLMSEGKDNFETLRVKSVINSYMFNLYYDYYNNSNFIPYVNAGLGVNALTLKFKDGDGSNNDKVREFSWQVGAGSYYKINNNLFADLGVKYNYTTDIKMDLISVSLGLRYNFDL